MSRSSSSAHERHDLVERGASPLPTFSAAPDAVDVQRERVGTRAIVDVDEVESLGPVPGERRRRACHQRSSDRGHDAGSLARDRRRSCSAGSRTRSRRSREPAQQHLPAAFVAG